MTSIIIILILIIEAVLCYVLFNANADIEDQRKQIRLLSEHMDRMERKLNDKNTKEAKELLERYLTWRENMRKGHPSDRK